MRWHPQQGTVDRHALDGVDAVIHLAGAGIGDRRWTPEYKRTLSESRVGPTRLIAEAIAAAPSKPRVLISASAIGIYGDRGEEPVDEASEPGSGFLADLCARWEGATAAAADAGVRVVHIRSGIVLSRDGGALARQLPFFKLGLGGRMGSGKQWQSWISIDDEVGAIAHLLSSTVEGPVNLTAPNPVRQGEFAKALGRAMHRPAVLPIPALGPKLVLGSELVDTVLLTGQKVLPTVLEGDGYTFVHPTLDAALAGVLG
jgi:uncharacterized protein (TIGR01777 family)